MHALEHALWKTGVDPEVMHQVKVCYEQNKTNIEILNAKGPFVDLETRLQLMEATDQWVRDFEAATFGRVVDFYNVRKPLVLAPDAQSFEMPPLFERLHAALMQMPDMQQPLSQHPVGVSLSWSLSQWNLHSVYHPEIDEDLEERLRAALQHAAGQEPLAVVSQQNLRVQMTLAPLSAHDRLKIFTAYA